MLPLLRHVPEVSVEEFIDAEELTFDTVCAGGEILFENVMWYRPRPLQMRLHEWVSPVSIVLRDLAVPELAAGRAWATTCSPRSASAPGFTHMEWYRMASGEAVFGEIAARPPGARVVELMNYSCDADLYVSWAEAVLLGHLRSPVTQKFNSGNVFKRAHGAGPDHRGRRPRRAAAEVRRARRQHRPAARSARRAATGAPRPSATAAWSCATTTWPR